jgi:hypothetical protein
MIFFTARLLDCRSGLRGEREKAQCAALFRSTLATLAVLGVETTHIGHILSMEASEGCLMSGLFCGLDLMHVVSRTGNYSALFWEISC